MKIIWITNLPSPYRVDFFNLLGQKIKLHVIFERSESNNRKQGWVKLGNENFKSIYLVGIKLKSDHIISFGSLFRISKSYNLAVISNPMSFVGILSIIWLRLNNIDYIIVGDGAILKEESLFKKCLKTYVLKGAKKYLSTSKSHDQYYHQYKVSDQKIIRYKFTSLLKNEILDKSYINSTKKSRLENSEYIVKLIFVGSIIPRKGIDILISAMNIINNAELHVYGGTKEEFFKTFRTFTKMSKNVYFHGFYSKRDILKAMKKSDIFVFPSREDIWGLVINEAMSQGLPIISTTNVVSAKELVSDEVNGYLIKDIDKISLAKYIQLYVENRPKILSDSLKSLEIIQEYTIENMVDNHIKIFQQI